MRSQTGQAKIQQAIKEPLTAAGWRPRAAGWFTWDWSPEWLVRLAISTAVEHMPRGQAMATCQIGVRHHGLEADVSALCEIKDRGYQQSTYVDSIGYLIPDNRWTEWWISDATVDAAAQEMTAAVSAHVPAWVEHFCTNPAILLPDLRGRGLHGGVVELARSVLASQRFDGPDAAWEALTEIEHDLARRNHGFVQRDKQLTVEKLKTTLTGNTLAEPDPY